MSGTDPSKREQPDEAVTEQARHGLEQVEVGDTSSTEQLDDARKADPAGAEAAEQEASDGPDGRGLAR
jgi:hypothetical protein